MSDGVLAIVTDYPGLHAALRARAEQLGVSRETLDDLAGLTNGHTAKLLSPQPFKVLGPMSMGALLGALGLKLVVIEDAEQIARIKKHTRYAPRFEGAVRAMRRIAGAPWLFTRSSARKASIKRWANCSPAKRSSAARRAALARWARTKN